MTRIPDFTTIDFTDAAPAASGGAVWLTPEEIAVRPVHTEADLAGIDFLDTWPGIKPFLRAPIPPCT